MASPESQPNSLESNAEAVNLKERGNAVFARNDFHAALSLYTRALALDGENPVLYANRAACYNLLKQYEKGLEDARKATQLDPSYSKGWWRLAEAHESLLHAEEALQCWTRAISQLPQDNLSVAQQKLKDIFVSRRALLEKALALQFRRATGGRGFGRAAFFYAGTAPWDRAHAMLPKLLEEGNTSSSAFVIDEAHKEFINGWEDLKKQDLRTQAEIGTGVRDGEGYAAPAIALVSLSSAYLMDRRSLKVESLTYADMVNRMISNEIRYFGAPDPSQKLETIIDAFLALEQEGGLDRLRPAVSVTVRSLLLRGQISMSLRMDFETAYLTLNKAHKILMWGRDRWPRGEGWEAEQIFSHPFHVSVSARTLDAYKHVGQHRNFRAEELLERAEALIADVCSIPPSHKEVNAQNAGRVLSFTVYAEAEGHTLKAWGLQRVADCVRDPQGKAALHQLVRDSLINSANCYPPDEEYGIVQLHLIFQQLTHLKLPLCTMLSVMERIRLALPHVNRIWEGVGVLKLSGLDKTLGPLVEFEKEMREKIIAGEYDLDSVVVPPSEIWDASFRAGNNPSYPVLSYP